MGEGSESGQWLLPGLWCCFIHEKAVPQHSPWCQTLQFLPICHWCPSSCCPGAGTQREWICISPKSFLGRLRGDAWDSCTFFCCPNTAWILHAEAIGTYLPGTGTLGWGIWVGLRSLAPEISLPIFIHHTWVWDCLFLLSVSPPLLPIWMNVTSLIPWLSDFLIAQFSDSSGWQLFCSLVVIFSVFVQGDKPCLPVPPSWPEVLLTFS